MTIYSIYKLTNSTNNKVYVGWTSRDPHIRFSEHQKTTTPKYQDRSPISYAVEKYGVDNFTFEIVYQSLDYDHSRQIESHFITECNSLVKDLGGWGYNIDNGGTGHKRTEITIEKHREKMIGKKQTADHIAKRKMLNEKNPMSKTWVVTFPDGHEEVITGLTVFAKERGLDPSNLRNTYYGKSTHHKSYKARLQ